jgi:hypothetical protein
MIRILTVAAPFAAIVAAALVAGPAAAADSIHIPTAGKSPEQLHADITKAAKSICGLAVQGATFPREEMAACMRGTVAAAVAQARDPALTAIAKQDVKLASR